VAHGAPDGAPGILKLKRLTFTVARTVFFDMCQSSKVRPAALALSMIKQI